MASKQYTDEFKAEAVKQVTERGFAVAEVANQLRVSSHSLYQWLRKAKGEALAGTPEGGGAPIGQGFSRGPALEGRGQTSDRGARHTKKAAAYFAKG